MITISPAYGHARRAVGLSPFRPYLYVNFSYHVWCGQILGCLPLVACWRVPRQMDLFNVQLITPPTC